MSIESLETVLGKLKLYIERELSITKDPDLTFEARERKYRALKNERLAFKAEVFEAFAREWQGMWQRAHQLQARQYDLDEKSSVAWNFERLNFAARQVEAAVAGAIDRPQSGQTALKDLEKQFENVMTSGDLHLRRAWAEFGAPAVRSRFGAAGDGLARRLDSELASILDTPELANLRRDGQVFANATLQLIELTRGAANSYLEDVQFIVNADILSLLKGVEVTTSLDTERGVVVSAVDYQDEKMHPLITERLATVGKVVE